LETVKRIRTMRGMNQVDLSEASGVSQNTISEIETGRRKARPATLGKLARALGVDIADFFDEPTYQKKARALSLRDTELETALPDDEVLFEAYYSSETSDEVWDEARREAKAKHHQVPEGMQIAMLDNGYKVEVRIVPVTPASRTRRPRRLAARARGGHEAAG
jgi:transcriptional regulator with XRE-family HTH domain